MAALDLAPDQRYRDNITLPDYIAPNSLIRQLPSRNILYITPVSVHALVPISYIRHGDLPVDPEHVEELTELFYGERESSNEPTTGQSSEITLVEVLKDPQFHITDGMHRVEALADDRTVPLEERPQTLVISSIIPNSTYEFIIKMRIASTQDHPRVKFSREVKLVKQAWELTNWAPNGINVSQAFALVFAPGMTGRNFNLDVPENERERELVEMKDWVMKSCTDWRLKPWTVYSDLSLAEISAPDLVDKVRPRERGDKMDGLTKMHLAAIASPEMLRNRHDLQRTLAEVVLDRMLTVPKTHTLVTAVIRAGAQTIEDMRKIINEGSWQEAPAERIKVITRTTKGEVAALEAENKRLRRELAITTELKAKQNGAAQSDGIQEKDKRIAFLEERLGATIIENRNLASNRTPANETSDQTREKDQKIAALEAELRLSRLPADELFLQEFPEAVAARAADREVVIALPKIALEAFVEDELAIAQGLIEGVKLPYRLPTSIGNQYPLATQIEQVRATIEATLAKSSEGLFSAKQLTDLIRDYDQLEPRLSDMLAKRFQGFTGRDAKEWIDQGFLATVVDIKTHGFKYKGPAQIEYWLVEAVKNKSVDDPNQLDSAFKSYVAGLRSFLPFLAKDDRRIIVLSEFQRLSSSDIGTIFGLTDLEAEARLRQARLAIAKTISTH